MPRTTHLKEEDLEEHFGRSSGPGGQKVNKASSRVTLHHLPSNCSVTIQDSRSQAKNREIARERLLQLIRNKEKQEEAELRQAKEQKRRREAPRPRHVKLGFVETKRRRSTIKKHRGRINPED